MAERTPISMAGFGSLPIAKRRAVVKDGVRRINGRQVDLLLKIAGEYGWDTNGLLAVVQSECPGVLVEDVGDCVDGPPMQAVVAKLKGTTGENKEK